MDDHTLYDHQASERTNDSEGWVPELEYMDGIGGVHGNAFPAVTLNSAPDFVSTQVLVKLAGQCGEDVHELLAVENLVPKLYQVKGRRCSDSVYHGISRTKAIIDEFARRSKVPKGRYNTHGFQCKHKIHRTYNIVKKAYDAVIIFMLLNLFFCDCNSTTSNRPLGSDSRSVQTCRTINLSTVRHCSAFKTRDWRASPHGFWRFSPIVAVDASYSAMVPGLVSRCKNDFDTMFTENATHHFSVLKSEIGGPHLAVVLVSGDSPLSTPSTRVIPRGFDGAEFLGSGCQFRHLGGALSFQGLASRCKK